jgi:cell fate regulator YaaT (PSP1 superfamily)
MEQTYNGCSSCNGCSYKGFNQGSHQKLNTYDWLSDLPETQQETDYVEVQFKNTRKAYFINSAKIPLEKGDIVAVESSPGHDIGEVTLIGRLVLLQMNKQNINPERYAIKKIYRKAKEADIEKQQEAQAKEQETMIRARQITEDMKLDMKIGDVEFQGDGGKAIFYYIADERVDFRQLIKVFAETFRIRIEMKQIGARQEAGRIGGIGPCGRELCCSSWKTNFNSVSTAAARYQDISMNMQKLTGPCGKIKCCIRYELDAYVDALKGFPSKEITLETVDRTYYHFKTDAFKPSISYSTSQNYGENIITISPDRAKEIIALNKIGVKPDSLDTAQEQKQKDAYSSAIEEDSLTRFDNQNKPKRKKRPSGKKRKPRNPRNE